MKAYVLMAAKPGKSKEVVEELKKVSEVKMVDSVYGRYDVIAVVEVPNLKALADILYRVVEKTPNVVRTETAIVLE
jgi:DNA-binding Lrp family transcriptional regulator